MYTVHHAGTDHTAGIKKGALNLLAQSLISLSQPFAFVFSFGKLGSNLAFGLCDGGGAMTNIGGITMPGSTGALRVAVIRAAIPSAACQA